jgi:hypothetical protein
VVLSTALVYGFATTDEVELPEVHMPDPPVDRRLLRGLHSRTDTGSIELPVHELTQAGAVTVTNGVLSVKNQQLADLIQKKLADASKLVPGGKVASDVDVGVTVKVKG